MRIPLLNHGRHHAFGLALTALLPSILVAFPAGAQDHHWSHGRGGAAYSHRASSTQGQASAGSQAQPGGNPPSQTQGDPHGQPGSNSHNGGQPQDDPHGQPQGDPHGQPQGDPHGQPQGDSDGQPHGDPHQGGQPFHLGQPAYLNSRSQNWWHGNPGSVGYAGPRPGYYYAPTYGYYAVPRAYATRVLAVGTVIPPSFRRYVVADPGFYGLPPVTRGYSWIYVNNTIVLIRRSSGLVVQATRKVW